MWFSTGWAHSYFLQGCGGYLGKKGGYVGKKTWRYNFVYGKHVYFLKHKLQNNISTNRNTKKIMIFNWAGVQRAHTGRSHNRTFMRSEIFMLWRTGNEAGDTSVVKKWKWSRSVLSDSLQPHGLEPTRLLHPWDFPGKNTGVSCHFLLQEIFPTQGLNPGLLHYRQMLYHLVVSLKYVLKSRFE